jgi:serine/threonine protein kinase
VKLADFGIAQAQGTLTEENKHALMGKLSYFAPEQLRGEPVDRRADLYAAALTIYNFATLSQPYRKESTEETLEAILEQPPPDVSNTRQDLPIALTEALAKAFSRRPDDRFDSARAFADAVPTPMLDASRLLASLVRAHCNQDIEVLEAKTNHALALNRSTSSVGGTATPAVSQTATPPPPGDPSRHTLVLPNRSPVLYAAAAVAALTLVGGIVAAVNHFSAPAPMVETSAPAGLGYLTVDAEPWATVWISGAQVGETPLSSVPLKAGGVDVELKNPETGKSKVVHVNITPGQKSFIKEVLR